ncbi:MAG TPA: hypothetical protein VGM63_16365 [Mucilaginibacter sp.]|jgi:drug/metabolite transporter (DMT)-like permease
MKKISITLLFTTAFLAANADPENFTDNYVKLETLHNVNMILTTAIYCVVGMIFIKWLLDHRLKNKLIDKGAPEHVVSQLLQPVVNDNKTTTIKWFALLIGLGTGLFFVNYYLPLGIHSLAIMCFSLAASFLGYYFYVSRKEKS